MADLDAQPDTTTSEERAARRLALGIEENPSTEVTLTFFRSPEAAAAMKRKVDRLGGEQAPADDVEPPDEAA